MLIKLIFLLHLTLSVQGEKIWKTKPFANQEAFKGTKNYVGLKKVDKTLYLEVNH